MDEQIVTHNTINGKYRVVFERAGTKGIDGFKVEVNGDDMAEVQTDGEKLYSYAIETTLSKPPEEEKK